MSNLSQTDRIAQREVLRGYLATAEGEQASPAMSPLAKSKNASWIRSLKKRIEVLDGETGTGTNAT